MSCNMFINLSEQLLFGEFIYFFCTSPDIHGVVGLVVKSRKGFLNLLVNGCDCERQSEHTAPTSPLQ